MDNIVEQVNDSTENNTGTEDISAKYEASIKEKKSLEQALSRQGYELGELRKLTDKVLLNQAENTKKNEEPIDFFVDPDRAVDYRIANNPKLQQIETIAQELKKQALVASLKNAHPDFEEVVNDEGFQDWVSASKVRQRLFADADKNYDIDAGMELIDNWKERQSLRKTGEAEANQKYDKDKALKSAKVDTGSSSVSSKKVYSRLDLMRLKSNDPDSYRSLNVSELYAQGRVK